MYCPRCRSPLQPGQSFCPSCGAPVSNRNQPTAQMKETPPGQQPGRAKGTGFWATSGGLVTIIFIGLLIIGLIGGVLIYYLTRDSGGAYSESVQKAWTQLNEVADEVDMEAASVTTLGSITSSEDTADFQKLLGQKDSDLSNIVNDIKSLSPPDDKKIEHDNLEDTAEAFRAYLQKTDSFLSLFFADINDTKLDSTLSEMTDLAEEIKEKAGAFIEESEGIEPSYFDPFVLQLATYYTSELPAVREIRSEKEKQDTEQATVEAVNKARSELQFVLLLLANQGWDAVVAHMTPELAALYQNANPPWEQPDFESMTITDFNVVDANKIIFTIEMVFNDGGETHTETSDWEMLKSGDEWLLNNHPYMNSPQ